jgi:hypothetical protein
MGFGAMRLTHCGNCGLISNHLAFEQAFEYWGCPACLVEAALVVALETTKPPCTCEAPNATPCELHTADTAYGRAWEACFLSKEERALVANATSVAEVMAMLKAAAPTPFRLEAVAKIAA